MIHFVCWLPAFGTDALVALTDGVLLSGREVTGSLRLLFGVLVTSTRAPLSHVEAGLVRRKLLYPITVFSQSLLP